MAATIFLAMIILLLLGFPMMIPLIVGAFIGALVGELASGKSGGKALRAGWGILIGNILGIGLKLAFSAVVLFYYIKEMF